MYMNLKKSLIIMFLLFAIMSGTNTGLKLFATTTEAETDSNTLSLTLEEAQAYAVKYSTETQNARIDIAMAKKKIWETTTTGLPQINGKISYTDNFKLPTTLIPKKFFDSDAGDNEFESVKFGTQHNASIELSVSQLVFSGSYIVALQASRVYLRLSETQLTKNEIDIKENVTRTYYLILLAEDNKRTLEANQKNVRQTLEETRELHQSGFAEDIDVDQLELSATDLENAIKSIDRQIEITYRLLKFQMGFNLNKTIKLSSNLDDILKNINRQELLNAQANIPSHIDYQMADTNEKAMKLLVKKEKATYLPTITAFFSYSYMAMRDQFTFFSGAEKWYPTGVMGLNIEIPIFSCGMRSARVTQAKMDLEKARNLKKQVENALELELHRAKTEFANALEKSDNTGKNVNLAKRIYDKTLEKYGKGMTSSLELTQAHNQYLLAQSNHTSALIELLNTKTRLDKILSRL